MSAAAPPSVVPSVASSATADEAAPPWSLSAVGLRAVGPSMGLRGVWLKVVGLRAVGLSGVEVVAGSAVLAS